MEKELSMLVGLIYLTFGSSVLTSENEVF